MNNKSNIDISVIIPIVERHDDLQQLYKEFSSSIEALGRTYEFIFVIAPHFQKGFDDLIELKKENGFIKIIKLNKNIGESLALSVGFKHAKGEFIFSLAAYFQVKAEGIEKVWNALSNGYDLVITRRYPRIDSKFNQIQSYIFHWLIWQMTSVRYHDITCGLRGMKRIIIEEINLYGDLHRFIPILVEKAGLKIKEIEVNQRKEDSAIRFPGFGSYFRRILDILTIFFITKFTQKPLRFFGLIGIMISMLGGMVTVYLGIYRIFGLGGIAHRPLLLFGVLLLVLGIQSIFLGLIAELMIFTHARTLKGYEVEKII